MVCWGPGAATDSVLICVKVGLAGHACGPQSTWLCIDANQQPGTAFTCCKVQCTALQYSYKSVSELMGSTVLHHELARPEAGCCLQAGWLLRALTKMHCAR